MTTPANLETYAAQTAKVLEIILPRGGAALVAAQLDVLFAHARMFAEFDLPPECEPLPEFRP